MAAWSRPAPSRAIPSPGSLIHAVPDAVHSAARIDRPYIREGWLKGGRRGSARGGDAFVPIPWDHAIRLVAEEAARVRAQHGHAAILGGSYGWASAGRYHHARTQLHACSGSAAGSPRRPPTIPTAPA
jgi:biotin/methionine sulfoxide reductase